MASLCELSPRPEEFGEPITTVGARALYGEVHKERQVLLGAESNRLPAWSKENRLPKASEDVVCGRTHSFLEGQEKCAQWVNQPSITTAPHMHKG